MSVDESGRVNGALWQDVQVHEFARGFGERIEVAMAARGMTKHDLSEATGAGYQHVKGWTVGRRLPGLPLLPRICEALDVDAHWLLGLERTSETLGAGSATLELPGPDASPEELEEAGERVMQVVRQLWQTAQARRLAERRR